MVGMLQIITYLLCLYLVYKGFEIFQIAFVSQHPKREVGIALGLLAIVGSIVASFYFINWIDSQAAAIGNNMQNVMPR
jgi:hypothetical protein